jgi:serine/threonine protein kinase/tetratricopeptide (TPR) repeat protein
MMRIGDDLTQAADTDSFTDLAGPTLPTSPAGGGDLSSPSDYGEDEGLQRGDSVGRYVVLETLGAGGMGVVHAAYDPELDRKLALKLLRPRAPGSHASSNGHARLIREAQAMAKLSHPNVVAVHDVGEHDGQVFLAMEFVEGQTVAAWLRAGPRPWQEVTKVFRAAGRGLAAAHEAGLVHRDFKPENVMIDARGRVKVMDFGLARARSRAVETHPSAPGLERELRAAVGVGGSDAITREGAIVGTPAYMAPEQYCGAETDARTDQFAFCVSLYEGLYGKRPFAGTSLAVLVAAICEGRLREAPRGSAVPAWLRRLVLRGLSPQPEQRWPSMVALLHELDRDPTSARRRWLTAGVLVALSGSMGYAWHVREQDRGAICEGTSDHLEGVWDARVRGQIEDAMLATKLEYASDSWNRVATKLDAYVRAWESMRSEACKATRVSGEQSEAVMDLRMACLDDRLRALRATTRVLVSADPELMPKAIQMVGALPRLDRCADVSALLAEHAPPEDPAVAAEVAGIEEQLADAKALESAGRYHEALEQATSARERAELTSHPPILARVLARQGQLRARLDEAEAEADLRRALALAIEHDMNEVATDVTYYLTYMFGQLRGDYEQAMQWGPLALAYARASRSPTDEAQALGVLGGTAFAAGKFDDARRDYEAALALVERSRPEDDYVLASMMDNLGTVLTKLGELDAARQQHERALALFEGQLGPGHPRLASTYNNLGAVARASREFDRARDYHERALAIFEGSLGKEHRMVGGMLNNIAEIARDQGDLDAAIAMHRRSLEIMVAALGADHLHTAFPLTGLGIDLVEAGRSGEAIEFLERAVALRASHDGAAGALASSCFALARALWDAPVEAGQDRARAREVAREALEGFSVNESSAKDRARVEAWLHAHADEG